MTPIEISAALQIILNLVQSIQAAHAAGSTTIPPAVWDEAISGRKMDQAKLEADIAAAKANP